MDRGAQARVVRRAQALALIIGVLLASACSRSPPKLPAEASGATLARTQACAAESLPQAPPGGELGFEQPPIERVARVEVRGTVRTSPALVRAAITTKPGELLEAEQLRQDVRRIWDLEVFEDVSASWERAPAGLVLVLLVRERPLIGRVFVEGSRGHVDELGLAPDLLYEPARVHRRARTLERSLKDTGFPDARVALSGVRRAGRVDVCAVIEPGPLVLLERLEFVGNRGLSAAELRAEMHTQDGAINTPGGVYRADALERDLAFLYALYYDRGMISVHITPRVEQSARAIQVVLEIDEGVVYRIGEIRVTGPLAAPRRKYRELLGARSAQTFSRKQLADGIERIRELHRSLGREALDVEPRTTLHPARARVDIELALVER